MAEIALRDLPIWHPKRNIPLVGMFYYSLNSKMRNEVKPAYGIASKTYNQLGESWTKWDTFVFIEGETC